MSAASPGELVTSGALPLAAIVAALAGLVSFASPCVLPLVPGFLGFVSGASATDRGGPQRGRVVLGAALFVLGFTVVFLLLFVTLTAASRSLIEHRELLMRIGGALVIALALVFLGLGSQRELKTHWRPQAGLLGAPLLGAVFGLGWAPCTGPTLAAIVTLSATTDPSLSRALTLGTAYGVGLGLPFVLIAVLAERSAPVTGWLRRHQRGIQLFGGALLLATGLLLLTGWWQDLMTWVQSELVGGFEVLL